jgi:hypothetical protein
VRRMSGSGQMTITRGSQTRSHIISHGGVDIRGSDGLEDRKRACTASNPLDRMVALYHMVLAWGPGDTERSP